MVSRVGLEPTTHSLKNTTQQRKFQLKTKKPSFNVRMEGLELNK